MSVLDFRERDSVRTCGAEGGQATLKVFVMEVFVTNKDMFVHVWENHVVGPPLSSGGGVVFVGDSDHVC